MENTKTNMAKNKKLKHALCYFALVILVILLFTPLTFKIIFREKSDEPKEDVVTVLNCTKDEEKINASFLNGEPKNITYSLPNNYSKDANNVSKTTETNNKVDNKNGTSETNSNETTNETNEPNVLLNKLLAYSIVRYDAASNTSSIKINADVTKGSVDYDTIFASIDTQQKYYESQGFTCKQQKI